MGLDALRPEPGEGRPVVDWGPRPVTPVQLYARHPEMVAGAVVSALKSAQEAEVAMTTDVLSALPKGVRAHGLAFRVKSPDSLARKLDERRQRDPFTSPYDVADRITDVVRYTAVSTTAEQVVGTAQTVLQRLRRRGWTITQAEHSYVAGNPYKGLHTLVRHSSGQTAEIQFHSEAAQRVKDRTHVDYEVLRDTGTPAAERAVLRTRMVRQWAQVPTPKGLDELTVLAGCPVEVKVYPAPKTDSKKGRNR